jgi:hypothetical protein
MDRKTRRSNERVIKTIKNKAVKDTETWILSLSSPPTKAEVLAFQAGYIYGMNRGTSNA